MFSESCNELRGRPRGHRSRKRRRDRRLLRRNRRQLRRNRRWRRRNWRWRRRNSRYRRERDPMLNSVLNGNWSNSVPRRKIPEGTSLPNNYRNRIHWRDVSGPVAVTSLLSHHEREIFEKFHYLLDS